MKSLFLSSIFLLAAITASAQSLDLKKVDVSTLKEIPTTITSTDKVLSILFNGDGSKLYLGSADLSMYVFDLNTSSLIWEKKGAEFAPVAGVGIPESTFFISAQSKESGGKIKLLSWDVGQESITLTTYTGGATGIAYHQGKIAWAGKNEKLSEFDININQYTTQPNWMQHRGNVTTVTYSSEGILVTGGDDGVVYKWDGSGPEEITYFDDIVSSVASSVYIKDSPESKNKIAAGDASGCLKVMDIQSGNLVYTDSLSSAIPFIRFHPTDPSLLVVASANELHFIDIEAGEKLKKITMKEAITALTIAEDGSKIAVGLKNGEVKLYSL